MERERESNLLHKIGHLALKLQTGLNEEQNSVNYLDPQTYFVFR